MLTLEMIKRLNEEDRGFWLNKCKDAELKEIIKKWRTKDESRLEESKTR